MWNRPRQLRARRARAAALAAAQLPDAVGARDRARAVASAQGADVVGCTAGGPWVEVVVEGGWSGPLVGWPGIRVRARAGPPGAR